MRICSFLPSGTEILFALGLGDSVMGVTFECDYPAEARTKPVVVYSRLPSGLSEPEVDRRVKEYAQASRSLYRLEEEKLQQIQPDLIVTQDLCHVCAASPNDLGAVLSRLSSEPRVLALRPRTVADVWSDILAVGHATGQTPKAREVVTRLTAEVASVSSQPIKDPPRVLCLEWLDPPFIAGHWVPEMVALAGGIDVLGHPGDPGYEVGWPAVVASDPDIILAMPCGYHASDVETELRQVRFPAEWNSLRAVQDRNVFAVDASSYFSRPGPRIADGIRVMADLFRRPIMPRESESRVPRSPAQRPVGMQS